MIFVSRPLAVFLCMIPFKQYKGRDNLFVSWVGLKGAVPIIFAILCMANGVQHSNLLFDVVFLCTIVSLLVQGTTLSKAAKSLHLATEPEIEKHLVYFDIDLPDEIQPSETEREITAEM